MPKQPIHNTEVLLPDSMRQELNELKQFVFDLQETIECLPIPGYGEFVGQARVGEPGAVTVAKGCGLIASGQLPGKPLTSCMSVRAWRNNDAANQNRTVRVDPAIPPNGFPPGTTVTVFLGPDAALGGPPPAGPDGPTKRTLGNQGGSEGFVVPAGQSVYVHYGKNGNRGPAGIRAKITDGP